MSVAPTVVLDALPTVEECGDAFYLDGHLLRGPDGQIRCITGSVCIDFRADDILSVEERGTSRGFGIPVRMKVRSGAAVLCIGSSAPFRDLIRDGPEPFAMLSREPVTYTRHNMKDRSVTFHLRERAFLERYGLLPLPAE